MSKGAICVCFIIKAYVYTPVSTCSRLSVSPIANEANVINSCCSGLKLFI